MDGDIELKRLRWRCRRGTRELDQLLTRYLEHAWRGDSDAQRAVFLRLLDCEDATLWNWFSGQGSAPDADLARLVARIGRLPPHG